MFLKCNFCVNETETNPTNNNQPQKQKEQPIKKKETWEMKWNYLIRKNKNRNFLN